MPAFVGGTEEALVVKVVSVFGRNAALGLPAVVGAVLVLEPHTGRPVALLEGSVLTAIRTGTASGAATDLLSRPDSQVVAVIGAGVQARTQLEAVCAGSALSKWAGCTAARLPRQRRWLPSWPGSGESAPTCTWPVLPNKPSPTRMSCAPPPLAATGFRRRRPQARRPYQRGRRLHTGHAGSPRRNGATGPGRGGCPAAALAEAGDLLVPVRQGLLTAEHIHAELGEILLERKVGRTAGTQVTLFKSVGLAVQDAVAAGLACRNARALGLGHEVPW